MDYQQVFAISSAGMTVERTRVDVAALNLANANTMQGSGGVRYQPLRVVATSVPASYATGTFGARFDAEMARAQINGTSTFSMPTAVVVPGESSPRRVYEPDNPFADDKGFIEYPGVNPAQEMVGMMGAMRAYEANVAAMNMEKTLVLRTLDIGGAQS
ncbi:flagellar basal-body rod protein FlgC [Burkholderia sp. MSh2]|uniref:Flagellar basal-body rod protein FlgC n=1 Tax=Burkholderia paludis TaxID=1506587 RepID=A0A6J5E423_9BURK|nr:MULTISPECIES: flagellar basal body rod protein FlgC [Burkholderia]KEZ01652.1 flagellar basal-body rod protein FlgC [Burkholderia sp. MSh2]KFG97856.1 flagellar basal-body rod protein FlgC [Burkholderia paludis]CAB3759875.1 Flagellar basal-body rod protein FlgC [Burkholderia paludis]VWC43763.1 flagellar basal body rod protein FlgC [Burkholderia paludis]